MYKFKSCECEFLNETTLWVGQGPHRHEGQKIMDVVENKPLPVNNNDTKVVVEKCINEIQIKNFQLIRGTEILY